MIRRFESADLDAVVSVWEACGITRWERDPRRTIARKSGHSPDGFFVGESDGRVVATCIAGFDGVRGWLYRVAVLSGNRRQGMARALVERAEAWLEGQGCVRVKLQVEPGGKEAVEFWTRLGYGVQELVSLSRWLVDRS